MDVRHKVINKTTNRLGNYCMHGHMHYNLVMRIKIFFITTLFVSTGWATVYVFPGNASAPLTLTNSDTLTVTSGTFNGGSMFTVTNSNSTISEMITVNLGATLSSSTIAIYAPNNGPLSIVNNGTLSGTTAAVSAAGSNITLTQGSSTPISGLISLGPNATVNFNSSAGSDNALYVGQNSTVYFNSTGSPATGTTGASGAIANINNTITLAPISLFDTININSGIATIGGISNFTNQLNVANGATLALGANSISGSGAINQAGTMTSTSTSALASHTGIFTSSGTTTLAGQTLNNDFRVTGGTTSITGISSFIINNVGTLSGGVLDTGQTLLIINNNAMLHQTGGNLKVNSSGSAGSFQIANGASYIIDGGTFDRGASGTTSFNGGTFRINGGTVNFANDVTVTNGRFEIHGGTFNYTAPGAMTFNGATYVQTGGTFMATSSAGVFNNPNTTVTVSGGILDVADTVFVENNVQVYTSGNPTILMKGGATFLSNVNVSVNVAFGPSSIPLIQFPNTAANFTNAVVNITNDNNIYVASGEYVFLTAAGAITVGVVNLPASNQFVTYSLGEAAGGAGLNAFVKVTRSGLQSLASSEISGAVGTFLENFAVSEGSNADPLFLRAVSNLQNISDMRVLDDEIFKLSPQMVSTFAGLASVESSFGQIGSHLLALRDQTAYVAGDDLFRDNVWMAPFGDFAYQKTSGSLAGYKSNSGGLILGIDHPLTTRNLIGFAASYTNSRVVPSQSPNSHTIVHSYLLTVYGSYEFMNDQYFDWLLAYSHGTNYSNRSVDSVNQIATAKYNTRQLAAEVLYTKDVYLNRNIKINPEVSALYVDMHQDGYSENGAGALDFNVQAANTSLCRLGAGGWLTLIPHGIYVDAKPQIYGALTYDVKAATQNLSANFVNTTPIFNSQATTPRLGGIVGGRITLSLKDNLDLIANANVQIKTNYIEKYVDLRLKYYF